MIYEFTPKQDLHGYSEPWAPGAGKNKLEILASTTTVSGVTITVKEDGQIITSGTATAEINFQLNTLDKLVEGQEYKMAGCAAGSSGSNYFLISTRGISTGCTVPGFAGQSVVATDEALYVVLHISNGVDANGLVFKPMICLATETDASFAPYENICPISGYDIWDPSNAEMVQVYSGYVDAEARKLYLHPWYTDYDGEELVGPWMSSMDKYTEEGTPTSGAFVVDMGADVFEVDITDFMLQTLLDSLGVRRFFASGAMLLNSLMDQAQGRVRSEEELLNRALPIHVIAIGKELPANLVIKKPISDVLPGLPGKTKI